MTVYPSRYNVVVADFPVAGRSLVHNTLRDSTVVVTNDALSALQGEPPAGMSDDDLQTLLAEGFIHAHREYEHSLVCYEFQASKFSKTVAETVIMMTEDCNLECKYCSERGSRSPRTMSASTAKRVAESLVRNMVKHSTKRLTLDFFGGEPLLNTYAMQIIASSVTESCRQNGVELVLKVTTNGTLLDRHHYDLMRQLGIDKVQVTIDGPASVHDCRKPTRTGGPSFETIMGNLGCFDGAPPRLQVRVNVDRHNYQQVPELLAVLSAVARDHPEQRPHVYIAPTELALHPAEDWNRHVFSPLERAKVFCSLWATMRSLELPVVNLPTYYPCGTMTDWAVVIGTEGEIYCCSALVGVPEFQRGSVFDDGQLPSPVHLRLLTEDVWKNCELCAYMPLCGGGCRVQALIRKGSAFQVDCQRDFFDHAYPTFLKMKYWSEKSSERAYVDA